MNLREKAAEIVSDVLMFRNTNSPRLAALIKLHLDEIYEAGRADGSEKANQLSAPQSCGEALALALFIELDY